MSGVESRLSEDLRARIKAYPGDLTYLDLIRRNRWESLLLMIGLILLAGLIGAVIAGAVVANGGSVEALLPSAALGLAAGLIVAGIGALWSWFGGSSAILRMSGAVPIENSADPELFNVVEEMSIAAGLPMPAVYVIPETALNAFATGRDPKHAAVAITTGLRERLTRDELQGVIAHEMAHVRHLDVRFAMLMATMVGLIVFVCDGLWRIALHSGGRGGRRGGKGGGGAVVFLVVALVLGILAPIVARFIQMAYSRRREYLADAGAVELTRNPRGLASALMKLSEDREPLIEKANRGTAHMFIVNPLSKMRKSGQAINSAFSSHPPIKERVARLMALER